MRYGLILPIKLKKNVTYNIKQLFDWTFINDNIKIINRDIIIYLQLKLLLE